MYNNKASVKKRSDNYSTSKKTNKEYEHAIKLHLAN